MQAFDELLKVDELSFSYEEDEKRFFKTFRLSFKKENVFYY